MFVRVKATSNSPRRSVQIVASMRHGDKVSQSIVRYVGVAQSDDELEKLKTLAEEICRKLEAEKTSCLPLFAPENIKKKESDKPLKVELEFLREEQRVIEGIGDVFGVLYEQLNFDKIFDNSQDGRNKNDVLRSCVLARIANPVSKLRTAALLEQDYGVSLPVDRIYRMMDQLYPRIDKIKNCVCEATLGLLKHDVDVLLYDVTTLHFESQESDELRKFGFSKAGKFNEVQLVLALFTSKEGLPLGYELFEGNKGEGDTLAEALREFAQRFNIRKVICVADRAMFSEKNLSWIEAQKWEFVLAAKLRGLSKVWKQTILQESSFKLTTVENEPLWVKSWEYSPKRKLVVSYSQERHHKDQRDRTRLIEKIKKKLGSKREATPQKLISNRGVRKFVSVQGKQGVAILDEKKIAADAQWDGLHGVIVSSSISDHEALTLYKQLWQIEAAFRLNKHDLKMRPVYHWTPERIKTHVAICFLSYALARHSEYRVALQYQRLSFEVIRNELLAVQASILRDIKTKKFYRLPSNFTVAAQKIYRCFGLSRSTRPAPL